MVKKKAEKESSSYSAWLIHIGTSILFGVLFLFLAINILFAVTLPNLDTFAGANSTGVVNFMKRTRTLPAFKNLFGEIKITFSAHEQEVYKDDRERRALITKLEEAIAINPKSRDVLYTLYLLYEKAGNTEKATEYLERAQAVDPKVGR